MDHAYDEAHKKISDTVNRFSEEYWEILKDNPNLTVIRERYYLCKCKNCTLVFSSEYAAGGNQIADTGDYDDIYCPRCLSLNLDDDYTSPTS